MLRQVDRHRYSPSGTLLTHSLQRKDDIEKPDQKDWWRLYAFCVVRHFDYEDDLDDTRLYVNPLPLRQLMHDVIGNYPSEPIDVDDVQISTPYHCLFHCRKELEAEGVARFEKAEDTESLKQLTMLMDWIKKHFELEIAAYERCVASDLKAISFDKLWTLFRPQSLVYSKVFNKPRAFRVWDHWIDEEYGEDETPGLVLRVEYMDYDGENLGTRMKDIFIPRYTGTRELCKLNAMPLDMLEDATAKRELLLKRGRLFESYVGQHYMQYTGVGFKPNPCGGYDRLHVDCRVMVDCKTFHQEESNYSFTVKELSPADEEAAERRALRRNAGDGEVEDEAPELRPLSDEEAIIATSMVRGYAFANKQFVEFFAEDLEPIRWNEKCFDQLVLDAGTKRTVQALVSVHSTQQQGTTQAKFDDIVKGKGQGVVCVLHGPPGVGKTLTAECVAEYVRRPLYMVSSGDLGVDASDLDKALARIMRMTSAWNAVLLIDEADVFLEQRSPQNLHRNAMVSVFLRLLEYFAGILFLTTNRVSSFDDAFKSRIHIPIRYTNLSEESRLQIWRNFLARIPRGEEADRPIVSEKELRRLAEHDLNGRQIKNVIKAAESLAAFEGKRLDMEQLEEVTKIQARFEADLTNLSGIDYTAPGASKKDAEVRQMFL